MDKFESLSHTAWDCKYHVTLIREYIKNQDKEDERLEPLGLWR